MKNITRWATAITLVLGALGCEKTSVEGAGGIVSEVWARVEGLGAAMGGDDGVPLASA